MENVPDCLSFTEAHIRNGQSGLVLHTTWTLFESLVINRIAFLVFIENTLTASLKASAFGNSIPSSNTGFFISFFVNSFHLDHLFFFFLSPF
ncbi:hypothetical protein RchiOBHm_Chr5g0037951 [Rosa chinensis]|uniref:Uncharacterized protein n=1 Tax=Rosa chinensis TaxID=74649 RepID=A0A2P6QBW4_ROSCH|nr:hypothetical protein RchiOBHm_Chr5g0037951 [Rosa chinensis]